MDIINKIPKRIGFEPKNESIFTEDAQSLFDWFSLIQKSINKKRLDEYAGVALHFLKEKELGGKFFKDVTYVKTLCKNKNDMWVENPPSGILLTFACVATLEQIKAGVPWPEIFKETYPPLLIAEFFISQDKAEAKAFLGWTKEWPGELLFPSNETGTSGTWQEVFDFINIQLNVLKKHIIK